MEKFCAAGLDTFGSFAFSIPYHPTAPDGTALIKLVSDTLKEKVAPTVAACYRRRFSECHTLALADMKSRLETPGDVPPSKRLPTAERRARHDAQVARIPGIIFGPEQEPGWSLTDRVIQMAEEYSVTYIKPELCVSRACEILAERHDAGVKLDSSGRLGRGRRRVISFEAMEEWHTYLFGTYFPNRVVCRPLCPSAVPCLPACGDAFPCFSLIITPPFTA